MTTVAAYEGRARRRCEFCGLEIEVVKPGRLIGRDSAKATRHAYATEIRRQVIWEATCPQCRAWWNGVISIAVHGVEAVACEERADISPAFIAER